MEGGLTEHEERVKFDQSPNVIGACELDTN